MVLLHSLRCECRAAAAATSPQLPPVFPAAYQCFAKEQVAQGMGQACSVNVQRLLCCPALALMQSMRYRTQWEMGLVMDLGV